MAECLRTYNKSIRRKASTLYRSLFLFWCFSSAVSHDNDIPMCVNVCERVCACVGLTLNSVCWFGLVWISVMWWKSSVAPNASFLYVPRLLLFVIALFPWKMTSSRGSTFTEQLAHRSPMRSVCMATANNISHPYEHKFCFDIGLPLFRNGEHVNSWQFSYELMRNIRNIYLHVAVSHLFSTINFNRKRFLGIITVAWKKCGK